MAEKHELSGWKAIADFLGVSVRAAQMWEAKLGLPVRRLPGARGRAFADPAELAAWKRSNPPESRPNPQSSVEAIPPNPPAPMSATTPVASSLSIQKRKSTYIPVAAALFLAASIILVAARLHYREPVEFRVESQTLRTFAADGSLVWERRLPEMPRPLAYDTQRTSGESIDRGVKGVFVDLDGSGRKQFVFIFRTVREDTTEIYCFGAGGDVRWKWRAGHDLLLADGSTTGPWVAHLVGVLKTPRPDGGRIVIASHHLYSWPEQIAVLTAAGKQVAEYWHPGWLSQMEIGDLDEDGAEEIILGGVNDGFSGSGYGATLVVLDSRTISGQGPTPEGDRHRIPSLPQGAEAAVLLFPEFGHSSDRPDNYCRISSPFSFREGHLDLRVTKGDGNLPAVHYQLDRKLRIVNIVPNMAYNQGLPPGQSSSDHAAMVRSDLGRIRVLANRFATQ